MNSESIETLPGMGLAETAISTLRMRWSNRFIRNNTVQAMAQISHWS
jgi:hypothetical protein